MLEVDGNLNLRTLKSFFTDGLIKTDDGNPVTLEDLLIFFSGTDREPPLGFHPDPKLAFSDEDLATASTCDLRICLPIKHTTYEQFKTKMILSLKGHDGFGKT